MNFYSLIFVSIIIEGLISYGKTLVSEKKLQWPVVISMALGVLCAVAFGIDIFDLAGIEAHIPYVGMVLTGVLLSRGSNYVSDILGSIGSIKAKISTTVINNSESK